MFLQWGFSKTGIVLIYCSKHASNIDFNRQDVYTVYVEDKEDEEIESESRTNLQTI